MPIPEDVDTNRRRANWWATRGGDWDQGCLGCGAAWWVVVFALFFVFFVWGWGFPGWGGWGGWGWRHPYNHLNNGAVTAPAQTPNQAPGR